MEYSIETKKCGKLKAYVQGKRGQNEVIFVTVHDLGVNHNEFVDFLRHEEMLSLASKCVWVHVEVPGQGDNEDDLPDNYDFPSMNDIGDAIGDVCDHLKITSCVLFGEGAGANILARFAMSRDDLVMGAILLHCTGTSAGFLESMRDKFKRKLIGHKLTTQGMNPKAESYLLLHRFGTFKEHEDEHELRHALSTFRANLRNSINPRNLNQYISSFMSRSSLLDNIGNLKCPTLFMTGALASHNHTVYTLYNALLNKVKDDPIRRGKIDFIQVDGVANLLRERPEKVSESLLYFIQGLGLASALMTRRMSNSVIQPSLNKMSSMEDYDNPSGPENLLYDASRKYSNAADTQKDVNAFMASKGDVNV